MKNVYSIYPAIDPSQLIAKQSFHGKCVIVTGASRGIGENAARLFAKTGASVVLVARGESQLVAVERQILKEVPNVQMLKIVLDVTDPTKVEAAIAHIVERFGAIDVLVAAAGRARLMNTGALWISAAWRLNYN